MARLKPGQSTDAATANLRAIQAQLRDAARPPNQRPETAARWLTDPFSLRPAAAGVSSLRSRYRQPLYLLMGLVALVLLIACANIANLLLARATARRHELSVRMALGSSRWRVSRLLLVESLLLSLTGSALGLVFARWGGRLLVQQLSTQTNSVFLELGLDWRVLGFTALIAIATTVVFGLAPALRATRVQPMESLKEQGRVIRGESRFGFGSALLAAQIALSLVIVVGAGLLIRTFSSLASFRLGFDRDPVLIVDIGARRVDAPDLAARLDLYERLRAAAAGVPGVSAASLSVVTPVSGMTWNDTVESVDGQVLADRKDIWVNFVSSDWFKTLGVKFVSGRSISDSDRLGSPDVIVVNQAAARTFFKGANPIGHTLRELGPPGSPEPTREVVGVVEDSVYDNLRASIPPTMYVPVTQFRQTGGPGLTSITLSVRSASGSPVLLTRGVASALERVDTRLALTFRPLSDYLHASLTRERMLAMLSGFFGALALLLAALGLYGVMSYVVSRRRTEIGIRMALGARPGEVMGLILRRVTLLIVAGIAAGAVLCLWLARYVGSLLFGLEPRDPLTLAAAALVLAAVGIAASWLPARRAARIDPTTALRES
jgi:predicted permease